MSNQAYIKGGRGVAAPYRTKTIRIPIDLEPIVEKLIEQYRESNCCIDAIKLPLNCIDAVKQAKKIRKWKSSSTASMQYLLQHIYGQKIKL
jgi:hypothetical protein